MAKQQSTKKKSVTKAITDSGQKTTNDEMNAETVIPISQAGLPDKLNINLTEIKTAMSAEWLLARLTTWPYDTGNYYHDDHLHQVAVFFKKNSAGRYARSATKRRRAKPVIKPVDIKPYFDRTHVIPAGYHGSEKDPRVVVGWDPDDNRGPMKDFEETVANQNQKMDILWFTEIELVANNQVTWETTIWDGQGQRINHGNWQGKAPFTWGSVDD